MLLSPERSKFMGTETLINVTVVYGAGHRQVYVADVKVSMGASVASAVAQSGVLASLAPTDIDALQLAIWGRKVQPSQPVRDKDRIEICRPLKVDPKVARRERFQRQGAKSAGLFNKRRAGAKAGY